MFPLLFNKAKCKKYLGIAGGIDLESFRQMLQAWVMGGVQIG